MLDPIVSHIRIPAQTARSTGLAALLQSGPVAGTVLSHQPGGKVVIAFQGQAYPLNLKGRTLQPGQSVLARMAGEQISLEVIPPMKSAPRTLPSGSPASLLSNLGITDKSAPALARAFIQAGIPLEQPILREVMKYLPNVSESQVSALAFLFSRGLPLSPMLLQWIAQIMIPKPRLSAQLSGVLTQLHGFLDSWEEDGGLRSSMEQREALRATFDDLVNVLPSLPDFTPEELMYELEILFQNAAASPEALIQRDSGQENRSFQESVVRLLAQLLAFQPMLEKNPQADEFTTLLNQVKILHETFAQAALQNLPQSDPAAYPVYLQIPYRDGETIRELQARYTPRKANSRAGSLDLRLELSQLGPLLIAIQWDAPRISVSLVVARPDIQQFLNPFLPDLTHRLQEQGLQVLSAGVVAGVVPGTLSGGEWAASGGAGGLDVRG